MTEYLYFLPYVVAISFFVLGREYKDYTIGILSGITFFLFGVSILITPLPTINDLSNLVLGNVTWAIGAYIFLRSSYEKIRDY